MLGTVLAAVQPDNTPHGYNWTFAYPMLLFIVVAGVLYLRFRSPHRVPGHVSLTASRWAGRSGGGAGATAAAEATAAEQAGGADDTAAEGAERPE